MLVPLPKWLSSRREKQIDQLIQTMALDYGTMPEDWVRGCAQGIAYSLYLIARVPLKKSHDAIEAARKRFQEEAGSDA